MRKWHNPLAMGAVRRHNTYMKNETAMTDKQAQKLRNAYTERAKVKVLMAANYDNVIIQTLGGFVFNLYNRAIDRFEAKHGTLN